MATLKVTNIKNESFAGNQLYLKSDGRIGIGIASPSRDMVHIHNSNANASNYIQFTNENTAGTGINDGTLIGISQNNSNTDGTGSGFTILNKENAEITLGTNNDEALRIDSSGRLLIGTTVEGHTSADDITIATTGHTGITIRSGTGNSGSIYFSSAESGGNEYNGYIIYDQNVDSLRFGTNENNALTLDIDKNATFVGNITSNNLSGRNLIINGAMQVAQRATTSTGGDYCVVDRFGISNNGLDEATTNSHHDLTSSDTGPWEEGFRHSFHVQNGNQTGGAGVDDRVAIYYKPEAQDIANSGWNYTSSSSYITFSFWVKSSVAQNFYGRFTTADGSVYSWPFETGSLSANTWTKVTKVIPGNANLQFDDNVGIGATLEWNAFRGTNKTGSIALDTWAAFQSSVRIPDMTSTWYTTNDATFEITGVQLEVGSIATKFDHNSYAKELTRCQRYYWKIKQDGGATSAFLGIAAGYGSGNYNIMCLQNPVEMRVPCSSIDTSGTAGDYQFWGGNAVNDLLAVPTLRVTNSMLQTSLDLSFNTSAGEARICRIKASTSAFLGFNAEL